MWCSCVAAGFEALHRASLPQVHREARRCVDVKAAVLAKEGGAELVWDVPVEHVAQAD